MDGTINQKGTITHKTRVTITIGDRTHPQDLLVTEIGTHNVILGILWLQEQNLLIDWKRETLTWDWERVINTMPTEIEQIHMFLKSENTTKSETGLSEKEKLKKMIPKEYHEFLDVFSEEVASRFPTRKPWDHKIELKEDFEPKSAKVYQLTPEEEEATKTFIKENLEKGYIRESKSPMLSSFFFVPKKDGRKRPCQDYRYLNQWTIKNLYPLPLITDIMD